MGKVLKSVANIATLGILGGSILNSGKKSAPAEPAKGPVVMPLADDEAISRAKRKAIAGQVQRGGRTSTILTSEPGSKLGGP